MGKDYPHYSDFADTKPQLEGTKITIQEIFNIEILVTGFRIAPSKYKDKRGWREVYRIRWLRSLDRRSAEIRS